MITYQTAKAILQDEDGLVLLLRRSHTHPKKALEMDLPGGIIEPHEEPGAALSREIDEETGLKIEAHDLKLVYTRTEENEAKSAVRLIYLAKLNESKPAVKISWEHDTFEWLPPEQAAAKLKPGSYYRDGLKYVIDHKIGREA